MPINQPTNQPTDGIDPVSGAIRKSIQVERFAIVRYLRSHADMQVRELADAIEAGVHLRALTPVFGPDPRD